MSSLRGALASVALAVLAAAASGCSGCETSRHPPPGAEPEPVLVQAASSAAASTSSAAPQVVVKPPPSSVPAPARQLTWVYDQSPVGKMQVVVAVPEHRAEAGPLPVLIAMHGRGEAFKGPARGARGWIDDYWLLRAIERLHAPPLTAKDFQGFADAERLTLINRSLSERPYRGLIVVCPYTPDILAGDRPFAAAEPLARFLVDELLPRVRRETPAAQTSAATGVDGVSLGGRASLLVGLSRANAFGAVAALQAAFDSADAAELARRAREAVAKNPKLSLRLLTSEDDYFLVANRNISKAFDDAGVKHELLEIPGPHDYEFNRGPGAIEMLLFHDRVLRGERAL
jgi:iron(III)-salmochelin esterase